jgi:hypothetical protein
MVVSPLLPSTNRNTPVQAPQLPCVQIYPVPVPAAASTQFPARSRRRPQRSLPLFLRALPARWEPVRRRKRVKRKESGAVSDSHESETALAHISRHKG